ncbi:MAG: IS110 family transposase [Erysipelotrichaceae bacterium]|nr:IS110 family transposase [Erysipelotrichaceae bacterium]
MDGPIITVDVSKGNCHYRPFLEKGKPLRKPKVLYDTIDGFNELYECVEKTKEKAEKDVSVVFEATGVYHRCLQKYLDDHSIPYFIISPLLSATYRKTDLHANKTDALDCSHIAKAYYGDERLYVFEKQEERFVFLQRLNRMYEDELQHLRKRKVAFRSVLDIIYPRLDRCFSGKASLYDPVIMEILKKYPHPKLLLRHKEETITKAIEKKTDHGFLFVSKIVHKVYECALQCYSGCDIDDIEVRKLPDMAEELQDQMERCESLLSELVKEASKIEYFNNVASIVGIGANLASRIIAEIGDISRFKNRKAISAYTGLNPKILQSGDKDGIHLKISKKGNRHLRCLLYLGATCNYRLKKGDPLYEFNQKKRQQSQSPLKSKAANIAAAHKLLVIIYALCKNGEQYRF